MGKSPGNGVFFGWETHLKPLECPEPKPLERLLGVSTSSHSITLVPGDRFP